MIIDNLDVPGVPAAPDEADSPLVVNSNAVLPLPIAVELLQTVAGRDAQIVNPFCRVYCENLRAGSPLNLPRQIANAVTGEDRGSAPVGKAPDHGRTYRRTVLAVKLADYRRCEYARTLSLSPQSRRYTLCACELICAAPHSARLARSAIERFRSSRSAVGQHAGFPAAGDQSARVQASRNDRRGVVASRCTARLRTSMDTAANGTARRVARRIYRVAGHARRSRPGETAHRLKARLVHYSTL
jgi:hypothetical protein